MIRAVKRAWRVLGGLSTLITVGGFVYQFGAPLVRRGIQMLIEGHPLISNILPFFFLAVTIAIWTTYYRKLSTERERPIALSAKVFKRGSLTDTTGGYPVEIEVEMTPGGEVAQIAWLKLEWNEKDNEEESMGEAEIRSLALPLTLERPETHRVSLSVSAVWRARGFGRVVAKAGLKEVRSPWFEMNPPRAYP